MSKYTKSAVLAASAIAMATSVTAPMSVAHADGEKMEKCYGIAAAGKNDCATATSSCAGSSKTDRQADAFITVPAGSCSKIAGGSLTAKAS